MMDPGNWSQRRRPWLTHLPSLCIHTHACTHTSQAALINEIHSPGQNTKQTYVQQICVFWSLCHCNWECLIESLVCASLWCDWCVLLPKKNLFTKTHTSHPLPGLKPKAQPNHKLIWQDMNMRERERERERY